MTLTSTRSHRCPDCYYDLNLIVHKIIIIPQPITYSGDQVVTPTARNIKNPGLRLESQVK